MNAYYLIPVASLGEARKVAPATGLPHELFHYALSEDGQTAIVQSEWTDEAAVAELGTRLGTRMVTGQAETAVAAKLAEPAVKAVWERKVVAQVIAKR